MAQSRAGAGPGIAGESTAVAEAILMHLSKPSLSSPLPHQSSESRRSDLGGMEAIVAEMPLIQVDCVIAATDVASTEIGALLSSRCGASMHMFSISRINDGPGPALCIRKTLPDQDLVMSIRYPVDLRGRTALVVKIDGKEDSPEILSGFFDWITKLGVVRIAAYVCNRPIDSGSHNITATAVKAADSTCLVINVRQLQISSDQAIQDSGCDALIDTALIGDKITISHPPLPPSPSPTYSKTGHANKRRFSYFIASADSNCPGEDRSSVHIDDDRGIAGFGVFDGHGGNLACDIAAGSLIDDTIERLISLSAEQLEQPGTVVHHIRDAFVNCDEFILGEAYSLLKSKQAMNAVVLPPGTASSLAAGNPMAARPPALQFSMRDLKSHVPATGRIPERAGSCAVVANIVKDHLYLSHIGDCRAVIFKHRPQNASPSESKAFLEIVLCDEEAFHCLDTYDLEESHPGGLGNNRLHRGRPDIPSKSSTGGFIENGGSNFRGCSLGSTVEVQGITEDHSCTLRSERVRVSDRTSDPVPFRPSRGDLSLFGPSAPVRVAGSLAVTRAFGDGYLKRRELSVDPYAEHLPYISCNPVVNHRRLLSTDLGLVLASDGFWNFVTADDVAQVLEKYMCGIHHDAAGPKSGHKRRQSFDAVLDGRADEAPLCVSPGDSEGSGATLASPGDPIRHDLAEAQEGRDSSVLDPAEMLLDMCIANAAKGLGMPASRLRRMVPGQARREIIDDVTVLVVLFDHAHHRTDADVYMDATHDEAQATNAFESPFHRLHKPKKHKSSHRDTSTTV